MIIKKLKLHNFGIYAGDNEFCFSGKKPIVLIGGLNGRGKTTFLNAILLSLFGENAVSYKESNYHSYGQYLKSLVNTSDGTNITSIETEFKMEKHSNEKYVVRRSWDGNRQRLKDEITVFKNGEFNAFLTENWDMYIESIIPSALSSFFFFDGEQIANLAVDETNEQIKDSIKSLLGINVIDTVEKDINKVEKFVRKTLGAKLNQKEADRLSDEKLAAEKALEEHDKKTKETAEELLHAESDLEEIDAKYRSLGGYAYEQEEDNRKKRDKIRAEVRQHEQNLINIASGVLPIALVPDLLDAIDVQSRKESKAEINKIAVNKVKEYAESYGNDMFVREFIEYIEAKVKEDQVETFYNLTPSAKLGVQQLNASLLNEATFAAKKEMSERRKKEKRLSEIENYMSIDFDAQKLGKLSAQKKSASIRIGELREKIKELENARQTLHGNQLRATTEYNRFIEKELQSLGTSEDSERILKYTNLLKKVFSNYKVDLQEKKLRVLADTITKCFKKLSNKKNLIDHIEIDNVTLDFTYYDKKHSIVKNSSLSAGEKQIMVVCILWGLAICSKQKLPVIIDTPLGRMDSDNRTSLIKKYFPNASEQTIILSTDTEITKEYYEMMKPNIGDEYTLVFDETTSSTNIHKGYLFGSKEN